MIFLISISHYETLAKQKTCQFLGARSPFLGVATSPDGTESPLVPLRSSETLYCHEEVGFFVG